MVSLRGESEANFQEIDRIGLHANIRNFVFLPLRGFNDRMVGITQLINKHDDNLAKELDRLHTFQHILGLMMDNLLEVSDAMDTSMNMNMLLRKLVDKAKDNHEDVCQKFYLLGS